MKVTMATSADVLACVVPIWPSPTAQKTLHPVQQVLAWCVAQGHIEVNVAKGDAISAALPKVKVQTQHRKALHWTELPDALQRIEESDALSTAKMAQRMAALTATRSIEVRGMTWTEVVSSTWTISASRTKSGKVDHRVPLSAEALDVLNKAALYKDESGLVFPSSVGRPYGPSSLLQVIWRRKGSGFARGRSWTQR